MIAFAVLKSKMEGIKALTGIKIKYIWLCSFFNAPSGQRPEIYSPVWMKSEFPGFIIKPKE